LGVQSLNNKILRKYGRNHTANDVLTAIKLLRKNNICNINLDFIYGINEIKRKDINDEINFIKKSKVTHASFYCLELKDNSRITKMHYHINDDQVDAQLKNILKGMIKINFKRYEVSNFCSHSTYESIHNKCY
jgi:oxygen-independent coproporphyrinogen-3 oxidase